VKRQIRRLEDPCLECVDDVHEELLHLVQNCGYDAEQDQQRFPRLFEKIKEILATVLSTHLVPTKGFVSNLVDINLAYINNLHPEFGDAKLLSSFSHNSLSDASSFTADSAPVQALKMRNENIENDAKQYGQGFPKAQAPKMMKKRATMPSMSQMDNGSALDGVTGSDSLNGKAATNGGGLFGLFGSRVPKVKQDQSSGGNDGRGEDIPTGAPVALGSSAEAEMAVASRKQLVYKRLDCQIVERLIRSYYTIVRKTIQDQVPKAIMHFLVNNVRDSLQNELVRHLYNSSNLDELLNESGSVAERRLAVSKMLDALRKASAVINEVRETYIW